MNKLLRSEFDRVEVTEYSIFPFQFFGRDEWLCSHVFLPFVFFSCVLFLHLLLQIGVIGRRFASGLLSAFDHLILLQCHSIRVEDQIE